MNNEKGGKIVTKFAFTTSKSYFYFISHFYLYFIRVKGVKTLVNKKLTFNKRGLLNVSALFINFFTPLALIKSESPQKNK